MILYDLLSYSNKFIKKYILYCIFEYTIQDMYYKIYETEYLKINLPHK